MLLLFVIIRIKDDGNVFVWFVCVFCIILVFIFVVGSLSIFAVSSSLLFYIGLLELRQDQ